MAILKRFELWMLLAFVTAGVGFVLFTHQSEKNADEEEEVAAAPGGTNVETQPKAPFEIEAAKLTADEDTQHWLLELQVRYRNQTGEALELASPRVQLKTEAGAEVPDFFLAFAPPPQVAPESEEVVDLRYWLDTRHRGEDLWLSILDERVPVELEATAE